MNHRKKKMLLLAFSFMSPCGTYIHTWFGEHACLLMQFIFALNIYCSAFSHWYDLSLSYTHPHARTHNRHLINPTWGERKGLRGSSDEKPTHVEVACPPPTVMVLQQSEGESRTTPPHICPRLLITQNNPPLTV